jgi:hypothetical protein
MRHTMIGALKDEAEVMVHKLAEGVIGPLFKKGPLLFFIYTDFYQTKIDF